MKLIDQAAEFEPRPPVPQPVLEGPLAALLEWQAMAEGAYSPNTLRAQKADGAIFQTFCEGRAESYLPADPKTIRAFIDDRVKAGKKPATIKRYVATIARVHIAAGLLNPCSSEAVDFTFPCPIFQQTLSVIYCVCGFRAYFPGWPGTICRSFFPFNRSSHSNGAFPRPTVVNRPNPSERSTTSVFIRRPRM
jgi:hypothetical protein